MPSRTEEVRTTTSERRPASGSGIPTARDASRATKDATKKAKDAAERVKAAMGDASGFLSGLLDGMVDVVGGWKELDTWLRHYNPALYDFASTSFLRRMSLANRPSKFLLSCIGLGIIQSLIPIFQWPLDFLARMLGFFFLYNSGIDQLTAGFARPSDTSASKVKSLLIALLIVSSVQLVPAFLFDTVHHFGALWCFFLPIVLFVTPDGTGRGPTVATTICDTVFSQISMAISTVVPKQFQDVDKLKDQQSAIVGGGLVAMLFWGGVLGGFGSYLVIWAFLGMSTLITLGKDYISARSSRFAGQMTIWHNLLAIWLWRYLMSAIEGICFPGIVSVLDLINHYLPSYFLWSTGLLLGMLVTKKTAGRDGELLL